MYDYRSFNERQYEKDKTELEHISVASMKRHGMTVNQSIYEEIFTNPAVRDLPRMAALYGCYSSFVVAHKSIFFVYGMDSMAIHVEPIVESGGWVFPEKVFKKTGYWPGPWFYCRDFNAIRIQNVDTDIRLIMLNLMAFELIVNRYYRNHMPMPAFFYCDEKIEREFLDLNIVIDNKLIPESRKQSEIASERQLLEDISIPEWPITQSGKKPGYLAYLHFSPFTTCSENDRKEKRNYERQSGWNDTFKKNLGKNIGEGYFLDKEEADWVLKMLDARDIPYHVMKEREGDVMLRRKHKNELYSLVSDMTCGKMDLVYEEKVTFSVHFQYAGIVDYYRDLYAIKCDNDQEIMRGNYLYFSNTKKRKTDEGDMSCGGCFLFFVPHLVKDIFLKRAKEMRIRLGRPTAAGWTHEPVEKGKWYVVDLIDMPATEMLLHSISEGLMTTHFVSLTNDAPIEYRKFDPSGLSIDTTRRAWHTFGKVNHLTSFDDLAGIGWMVVPKYWYIEQQMLVDNYPGERSAKQIEDFQLGRNLPTYGQPRNPVPKKVQRVFKAKLARSYVVDDDKNNSDNTGDDAKDGKEDPQADE